MQINISTIDNKGKDIYLTWREFITDLLQPHNSIKELKRKELKGEDINPYPSYHINFKTIKGEDCNCELTLNYEGCDYKFDAWVNGEEQKQFPYDAVNHFNLELYIKSLYMGEIEDFYDSTDFCKKLDDKEKVWVHVASNVKSLYVVNVKEISYKESKWEVTLTPYKGEDNNE